MVNQSEFIVSIGDETLEPMALPELLEKLATGSIAPTDFVYLEDRDDWAPLFELSFVRESLSARKPSQKPANRPSSVNASSSSVSSQTAALSGDGLSGQVATVDALDEKSMWFVQRGSQRVGPMTRLELIRAMQTKMVYTHDLAWHEGPAAWQPISDIHEFSPAAIRELVLRGESFKNVFALRRHERSPFHREVILTNQRQVWLGRAYQGSAGGSGLIIESSKFSPGEVLHVHFAAHESSRSAIADHASDEITGQLPAFSAVCEIVSKKQAVMSRRHKAPAAYGVRFIEIEPTIVSQLRACFLESKTKF